MWADQVPSDDPAHSIEDASMKREISGYVVEEPEPMAVEEDGEQDQASPVPETSAAVPSLDDVAVREPSLAGEVPGEHQSYTEPAPIAFPSSEIDASDAEGVTNDPSDVLTSPAHIVAEPLTFPTTEEPSSQPPPELVAIPHGPAVTFGENVNPPRTGTPDPESEPKRKRISSQNFQRLARRISLTTRRQSSTSIIPGLKRDNSPRVSTESRGESTESPASSIIKGDADKGKSKKKDKKEQKDKSKKASS